MGIKCRPFFILPVALSLWTGCFNPFAPKLSSSLESGDLLVTEQTSPEEVLQNFKVAYTLKDSLLYSGLLDTEFVFVYFDPDEGTSGAYVSWGRDVDLFTTGRLLRHFSIIDLVWNSTLYSRQGETTGEISKTFVLTLVGTEVDYTLSGKAVFSFRKCMDDKWRITQWKDESDI
jgi:hypothetical protein